MLSINQLIAFSTNLITFKVRRTGQPVYLAKQLNTKESIRSTRQNQHDIKINFHLSTAREGFVYKAPKLWSYLPVSLKLEINEASFKSKLKSWCQENIPALPT